MKAFKALLMLICFILTSGCATPDDQFFSKNLNYSTQEKFKTKATEAETKTAGEVALGSDKSISLYEKNKISPSAAITQ